MTDRTHLMTAALSMTPTDQLAVYTTRQLREAALDAEPRLLAQMENAASLTAEETEEWFNRVRALNIITAEVLRREKRDTEIGPQLIAHEDGYRLVKPLMCF